MLYGDVGCVVCCVVLANSLKETRKKDSAEWWRAWKMAAAGTRDFIEYGKRGEKKNLFWRDYWRAKNNHDDKQLSSTLGGAYARISENNRARTSSMLLLLLRDHHNFKIILPISSSSIVVTMEHAQVLSWWFWRFFVHFFELLSSRSCFFVLITLSHSSNSPSIGSQHHFGDHRPIIIVEREEKPKPAMIFKLELGNDG